MLNRANTVVAVFDASRCLLYRFIFFRHYTNMFFFSFSLSSLSAISSDFIGFNAPHSYLYKLVTEQCISDIVNK